MQRLDIWQANNPNVCPSLLTGPRETHSGTHANRAGQASIPMHTTCRSVPQWTLVTASCVPAALSSSQSLSAP